MSDCPYCANPGSRWDIYCDDCVLRRVKQMPDREHRRQVLMAVRMRRGRGVEERIRKLVEQSWRKE